MLLNDRKRFALLATLATAVALAPLATAEPHGDVLVQADVPHTFATEEGTYYFFEEANTLTIWKETNGVLTGGEYHLVPHNRGGLQTEAFCLLEGGKNAKLNAEGGCTVGTYTEADTQLTEEEFADEIVHGLTHEILA